MASWPPRWSRRFQTRRRLPQVSSKRSRWTLSCTELAWPRSCSRLECWAPWRRCATPSSQRSWPCCSRRCAAIWSRRTSRRCDRSLFYLLQRRISPQIQACFFISKRKMAILAGWESALAYLDTLLSFTENSSDFVVPIWLFIAILRYTILISKYFKQKKSRDLRTGISNLIYCSYLIVVFEVRFPLVNPFKIYDLLRFVNKRNILNNHIALIQTKCFFIALAHFFQAVISPQQ